MGRASCLLACMAVIMMQLPHRSLAGAGKGMEETSSINVATMTMLFVVFSFAIEKILHVIRHFLQHHKHIGLLNALEKIQTEILLVGMISLFLLVFEDDILTWCVEPSDSVAVPMNRGGCDHLRNSESAPSQNCTCTCYPDDSRRRRNLLAAAGDSPCKGGQVRFVDANALHQIHYLIFFTACVHITYSLCVYFVGRWRTIKWIKLEEEIEADSETFYKSKGDINLRKIGGSRMMYWIKSMLSQFLCRDHDHVLFIAIRKFYIAKNNLHHDFKFYAFVDEELERDFGNLAGISWWMWILIAIQILIEGFMHQPISYGTSLALILSSFVGAKMILEVKHLSFQVLSKFDKNGDGTIDIQELKTMETENADLNGVEPNFWFNRPKLMLQIFRALMFQNAISVMTGIFYTMYFGRGNNCYMGSRADCDVYVPQFIGLIVWIHHGAVVLPHYALVMHLGNHRELNDFLSKVAASTDKIKKRASTINFSGSSKVAPATLGEVQEIRKEHGAGSDEYKEALKAVQM